MIPPVPCAAVAARGLDVKDLVLVVNYDVPNHHEDYVHRWAGLGAGLLCCRKRGMVLVFVPALPPLAVECHWCSGSYGVN